MISGILIPKFADLGITTRQEFKKKFQKNLQYKNGWASSFESFDECVKAWFWEVEQEGKVQKMPIERIWLQEHDRKVREQARAEARAEAIDEFAKKLKERLIAMQQAELQGEDLCHCSESGEDCRYMYQDVTCQYCAREQAIKDVDEIAEQMKAGGK